jgi:phosphatidylinositol alpha-mannosyltransferase
MVSSVSLRIGMVCPYSLSIPGGVQAQVLGLARHLRRGGHEVRVLAPCDGPPPEPFVTPLGDSLPTAANGSIAPLAPDPAAALRTLRVLRDEVFDVVHVHEPLAPGPSLTTVTLHVAPTVGTFHAAGRSTSYRLLAPLLRRLLGRIDAPVAVSKDALTLVQRHLGGEDADFTVLFNGVETGAIRAATPMPTTRPAIFFLGRHEERKGLAVLLEAVRMLTLDVSCWVAGDGPDTDRLRIEHAGDARIEWLGRIDEPDKLARLRAASVVCAPSLHGESFGVVLIEAMAAGTPVVASSLDGYRNVATDGVDALLVEPGNARALAGALERVLCEPALAAALVAKGTDRADQFSMSRLADEYVAIYTKLAAGVSGSRVAP